VARRSQAPIAQTARDFGISEGCLERTMKAAEVEDSNRVSLTQGDLAELLELHRRIRRLNMENETLRRAAISLGRGVNPRRSVRRSQNRPPTE
jgi:transposase